MNNLTALAMVAWLAIFVALFSLLIRTAASKHKHHLISISKKGRKP